MKRGEKKSFICKICHQEIEDHTRIQAIACVVYLTAKLCDLEKELDELQRECSEDEM